MRRIKRIIQNVSLILTDWRFGREIRRDLDFLRSLCDYSNSLYTLFMKDFAVRGRWIFQFFHFVVSSFIKDMLIRTHKKLIVYNFLVNYIAIYRAESSRGE
jgi:hypothetical protein